MEIFISLENFPWGGGKKANFGWKFATNFFYQLYFWMHFLHVGRMIIYDGATRPTSVIVQHVTASVWQEETCCSVDTIILTPCCDVMLRTPRTVSHYVTPLPSQGSTLLLLSSVSAPWHTSLSALPANSLRLSQSKPGLAGNNQWARVPQRRLPAASSPSHWTCTEMIVCYIQRDRALVSL